MFLLKYNSFVFKYVNVLFENLYKTERKWIKPIYFHCLYALTINNLFGICLKILFRYNRQTFVVFFLFLKKEKKKAMIFFLN